MARGGPYALFRFLRESCMNEQFAGLKVERNRETVDRIGESQNTLDNRVDEGLFTSTFNLCGRAEGRLAQETTTLIAAMAAGLSKDEIRILVNSLHAARKKLFESVTREYAISA